MYFLNSPMRLTEVSIGSEQRKMFSKLYSIATSYTLDILEDKLDKNSSVKQLVNDMGDKDLSFLAEYTGVLDAVYYYIQSGSDKYTKEYTSIASALTKIVRDIASKFR